MNRIRAPMATVALTTSDAELARSISTLLSDEVTSVSTHISFASMRSALATASADIVVLDDRSDDDASTLIRALRRTWPSLHIVYVHARDEPRTVELLDWGADDAIVRGSSALAARLHAATRRARTLNAGARIAVGDIVYDREGRRVWCAGRQVALTPHELAMVDCLFWHAPNSVGVDTLADFVWGGNETVNRRSLVQVYMSYVRRKLRSSGQVAIRFVRGGGYAFSPKP